MKSLLRWWEGLPWWVGVLLLGALFLYATLRAGYELWKEEEQARRNAEQERDKQKLPETLAEWLEATPLITVSNLMASITCAACLLLALSPIREPSLSGLRKLAELRKPTT